ncbi:MAG TPA: homogentisate 1,2-dioxygenase, partial [Xanthomarina gelatinilytica]|nr:homogentisate 1,2-dioxygenase [Xanthomarina gelatinilytica]
MPFYHKLGNIPPKRHIQFRKPDGTLYNEQLFGTIGFDGMSTNSYHEQRPTQVKAIKKQYSVAPKIAKENSIQSYRFRGFQIKPENDYLESRKTVLTNSDCSIILAAPKQSTTDYFYKNSDADELIFIHKGTGKLRTHLGNLDFKYGDYLLVPRGTIYKIDFDTEDNRLFIVESRRPIYTPKRYRNWFGQLLEHAPFCERDIRQPQELETYNENGDFLMKVKKQDDIFEMVYASHPFDVVGYDGYSYPYAFSIHDFEPITGRIHQPPPVHQTFETDAFVVCSFVPRLYDYHPLAIPAPYNHSNIDSDEVLYYVDGDFMSRNDIDAGHISLHPAGIPHGPHPGAAERSIGKVKT